MKKSIFIVSLFILVFSCNLLGNNQANIKKDVKYIEKYLKWKYAIQNPKDYSKVFLFFYNNPHWPLFKNSVKIAEENIDEDILNEDKLLMHWFKRYQPISVSGLIKYSKLLLKYEPETGIQFVKQTWVYQNLTSKAAKEYRKIFKDILNDVDDAKRAKHLIQNRFLEQLNVMKEFSNDQILNFIKSNLNKYFQKHAGKFTKSEISNYNIRYNITQNFIDKKNIKSAANILILTNENEEKLGLKFFNQRRHVAFELVRSADAEKAYRIMKMAKISKSITTEEIAKSEWLLGYISYKFLADLKKAKKHFETAYKNSKKDIRKSKNAFWLAEVFRSSKEPIFALNWYKLSAKYYSTFYGYLAYKRLKTLPVSQKSEEQKTPNVEQKIIFNNRELVQILKAIQNFENDETLLSLFYSQLVDEIEDPEEEELLLDFASSQNDITLIISTLSQKQHYLSGKKAYKLLSQSDMKYPTKINDDPCFLSLVHAVIQRESNFNPNAQSHVGAVGLMQVMPKTAAYEAKKMKIHVGNSSLFMKEKNLTIGSFILNRLLKKYDNIVYAIGAYNCGEGNIAKYKNSIKKLKNLNNLDIIELIPIKETRVYVKHVIRNIFEYQQRFKGENCYDYLHLF